MPPLAVPARNSLHRASVYVACAATILTFTTLASQPLSGQSRVTGNVLSSTGFPPATIRFDEALAYAGVREFVLYGVANTTVHLFVGTDGRRVSRLYWVQFEGYLPGVDRTYDYSDAESRTPIAGATWFEDAWLWNLADLNVRPGSDTDHVLAMLRERGLELPPLVAGLRLVQLDASARRELMIVYLEDVELAGIARASMQGSSRPGTVGALRQRALSSMSIGPLRP